MSRSSMDRLNGRTGTTGAAPIRVLLVEDHAVVREGLRLLLERQPDVEIVGEASRLEEVYAIEVQPDVVVADLMLRERVPTEVVTALRTQFPNAAILVLTIVDSPIHVHLAFRAGARGYLLKESASEELVRALRAVAHGEEYLQPSLGAALIQWRAARSSQRDWEDIDLTEREREVLSLLALGNTNAAVAAALGLALRTVEAHRARLMEKLGTRSRTELVRFALEAGIIDSG